MLQRLMSPFMRAAYALLLSDLIDDKTGKVATGHALEAANCLISQMPTMKLDDLGSYAQNWASAISGFSNDCTGDNSLWYFLMTGKIDEDKLKVADRMSALAEGLRKVIADENFDKIPSFSELESAFIYGEAMPKVISRLSKVLRRFAEENRIIDIIARIVLASDEAYFANYLQESPELDNNDLFAAVEEGIIPRGELIIGDSNGLIYVLPLLMAVFGKSYDTAEEFFEAYRPADMIWAIKQKSSENLREIAESEELSLDEIEDIISGPRVWDFILPNRDEELEDGFNRSAVEDFLAVYAHDIAAKIAANMQGCL